jgi:hypothetical protein
VLWCYVQSGYRSDPLLPADPPPAIPFVLHTNHVSNYTSNKTLNSGPILNTSADAEKLVAGILTPDGTLLHNAMQDRPSSRPITI